MAYSFIKDKEIVEEGSTITIRLTNPSLPPNTIVPYQIFGTGVNLSDFDGLSSLSGSFVINNQGSSLLTLSLSEDFTSDGTETVFLALTNPSLGGGTTTSFVIADTSKTSSNAQITKFSVSADPPEVPEGANVTFTVLAQNIPGGSDIVVPYTIIGIQEEDIVGANLFGNLVFAPTLTPGNLSANVTFTIREDFTDEGIETIVLLVFPSFAYTLEVTQSVSILDTSIDNLPKINLIASKVETSEFPGTSFQTTDLDNLPDNQVRIFLRTQNIPDGFSPVFKLFQQGNSVVTLSDFKNIAGVSDFSRWTDLETFEYNFPPTFEGNSNILITIAQDNLFEPIEFFSIVLVDYNVSSPIIAINDSIIKPPGEEFGANTSQGIFEVRESPYQQFIRYPNKVAEEQPEEYWQQFYTLFRGLGNVAYNSYFGNITVADISLDGLGIKIPKWEGFRGLLSSTAFIQGRLPFASENSPVYYQPFSYVIRTKKSYRDWENSIKSLIHPAGMVAFGEINIETEQLDVINVGADSGTLEISATLSLTTDSTDNRLRVSNLTYSDNNVTIPLQTDLTFRQTQIL